MREVAAMSSGLACSEWKKGKEERWRRDCDSLSLKVAEEIEAMRRVGGCALSLTHKGTFVFLSLTDCFKPGSHAPMSRLVIKRFRVQP